MQCVDLKDLYEGCCLLDCDVVEFGKHTCCFLLQDGISSDTGFLRNDCTVLPEFTASPQNTLTLNTITRCSDRSVGVTTTRYGLDGPAFEPRWVARDFLLSRPVLGPTPQRLQ